MQPWQLLLLLLFQFPFSVHHEKNINVLKESTLAKSEHKTATENIQGTRKKHTFLCLKVLAVLIFYEYRTLKLHRNSSKKDMPN